MGIDAAQFPGSAHLLVFRHADLKKCVVLTAICSHQTAQLVLRSGFVERRVRSRVRKASPLACTTSHNHTSRLRFLIELVLRPLWWKEDVEHFCCCEFKQDYSAEPSMNLGTSTQRVTDTLPTDVKY